MHNDQFCFPFHRSYKGESLFTHGRQLRNNPGEEVAIVTESHIVSLIRNCCDVVSLGPWGLLFLSSRMCYTVMLDFYFIPMTDKECDVEPCKSKKCTPLNHISLQCLFT